VRLATSIFPGRLVSFPVKYLRMPLVVAKSPCGALQPLLDNMADRMPAWRGRLLCLSRRLMLIKTTLSTVPIHTSIHLSLPPWLLSHPVFRLKLNAFFYECHDQVSHIK
jgi:hypothetical protein